MILFIEVVLFELRFLWQTKSDLGFINATEFERDFGQKDLILLLVADFC